jgi:hypothetical protein
MKMRAMSVLALSAGEASYGLLACRGRQMAA